jgi:hypothetical protein
MRQEPSISQTLVLITSRCCRIYDLHHCTMRRPNIRMISPQEQKLEPDDMLMFSRLQLQHPALLHPLSAAWNTKAWCAGRAQNPVGSIWCLGYNMLNDTHYPFMTFHNVTYPWIKWLSHKAEWYTLLLQAYLSINPFQVCPSGWGKPAVKRTYLSKWLKCRKNWVA